MALNTELFTEERVKQDAEITIKRIWSILDSVVTLQSYSYNDIRRAAMYANINSLSDDIIARQQSIRADLGLPPEITE